MMKIHEKAHEKEETLGAEGQKFFKKAILRDDSSLLRYSTSKDWLLLASCNTEAVDFNMRDAQTNIL